MLKPSQLRFRFPIRVYDPKYKERSPEDRDETMIRLTGSFSQDDPSFVIARASVFIDHITTYIEAMSRFDDIEEAINKGLSCTHVILNTGEEYVCDWDIKRFEEAYDKHIERLENDAQESLGYQEIEINDDNLKEFEAAIKDFKLKRKEQKLQNKQI